MKRKIFSILLTLVLVLSFSLMTAVPASAVEGPSTLNVMPIPVSLSFAGGTADWSTAESHTGSNSIHLKTTSPDPPPPAAEARAGIMASSVGVYTLADIDSISWWEYLVQGYPPHIDIGLDIDGNGSADDWLVIEYAYNTSEGGVRPEGQPSYGALTGAWYQTFSDDTLGPAAIDDGAYAWLTSQAAGPVGGEFGADGHYGTTLADWKAGKTVPTGEISASTVVTHFVIEVDNWRTPLVQADAYVDDIAFIVNGMACFGSIQYAIDSANPNDTINVAAGEYNENITIDRSLTLEGAQAGENARGRTDPESVINAQEAEFAVLINGAETVATIDGFTVENYDTVGILGGAFSDVLEGVALGEDPLEVHILNNIVKPPTLEEPHNNNIQIGDGTTGTIIGNEVSGAFLESGDWSGSGIIVAGSSNVVVSNNHADDCEGGIQLLGYAEYRGGPAAVSNLVESNLVENCDTGISVQGNSIGTIIRHNDVLNNDVGIDSMAYDISWDHSTPSGTEIHYNNIVGNEYGVKSVVYWHDTGEVLPEEVNASNNYWGDISGPECEATNPGGTGGKVSDNVEYIPWLTRDFQTVLDDNIAYFGFPMVQLNTGWNTFSTPVALDSGCDQWDEYVALGDGLSIHSLSPAYAFDAETQEWLPLILEDADYELKPCDAIYVRMAEPDIAAILYSPEPSAATKDVSQGWNLVGLASLDPMPVGNALTSLYMATGDITGYSMVISPPLAQSPWTFVRDGDAQDMRPTHGYWVFMENGPDTLAGFTFTPFSLEAPPPPPPPPLTGALQEVSFQWYPVTEASADYATLDDDDSSFTYNLPWSFPFASKDIVAIEVSAEGYIELLESGEDAESCCKYGTMWEFENDYPDADFIVAWCDDLVTGDGYYAVEYDSVGDKVIVHWTTAVCCDELNLNYFQLWLFPDGSIQWNFKEFNYETLCCGIASGIYESDSGTILNMYWWAPEKSYLYSGEYLP